MDEFFTRSREHVRKLDRRERIPARIIVVFEDPADLLESFGLLTTRDEPDPGHGRQKIVASLTTRYGLVANI